MPESNELESSRKTSRKVCLTWHGEVVSSPPNELDGRLTYFAYAVETCPTTSRRHLQAFAYGTMPMRLQQWKDIFPGAHIEFMRGSFRDNQAYCSKEGQLVELGVRPMANGKRRSDQIVKQAIDADPTKSMPQIYEETGELAAIAYSRAMNEYRLYKRRKNMPINEEVEVFLITGPPGTGKTRYVFEREPDMYEVPMSSHLQWFDGYEGQEAVLFDNLTPESITNKGFFLRLIDRYRVQVPIKGGFTYWKPKRVYITSINTSDAFASVFNDMNEWYRRITTVIRI